MEGSYMTLVANGARFAIAIPNFALVAPTVAK
ncbi:hypothetical protein SAMN05518849_12096 [Sphingobium sp. AP50]|nr:hypothetical protein SAMN05518849_12096 [Sphingobium sp. AP50]